MTITLPVPDMRDGIVITFANHRWTNMNSDPTLRETAPRVLEDGATVNAVGWTYLGPAEPQADTPVTVEGP